MSPSLGLWHGSAAAALAVSLLCLWCPGARAADFYKILGINEFADAVEIKKAYRTASLKYHPDRYRGDPAEAQAIMVQINDAFNCLKDPATRKMYEYYPEDYLGMAEYEEQLTKNHVQDLYLYDANVHIVWGRNKDDKMTNMTRTMVVNLYHPRDPDSRKQVAEFKRFGKMAAKSSDLRAAVVNCEISESTCRGFWSVMGQRKLPALLIFSTLQTDESQATDFEVWNEETLGFPTAKEIARQARKLVSHEVIQADGPFLEANVLRNPWAGNATHTDLTVWIVWFYHSARCSKKDVCDKTVGTVRQLSVELKGVARIVAIDCKLYKDSCKGHIESHAFTLKAFIHRGPKHFVEAFKIDGVTGSTTSASALKGVSQVLRYVLKPQVNLTYPPNPFKPTGAAEDVEADVDLTGMDPKKMKIGQLKQLLAQLGAKCVGCSEKSDFVAKVLELRPADTGRAADL
eukprot:CAMPEP_0197909568 /NCGR_PEP_ID=MMETSP1439-20131203/69151_1 /TAXON_ID=66791 /ORGANISM="Gonyaulax spinifera, Strain CCMP409" /LENGTH=458 /DNA_ID=CAMNT_0043531161 /DNA_START=50 /DNA_END=1426 /DNA_ORIENTATION=+